MARKRENQDIIRLNIGGKEFMTRRATLCAKEGLLEQTFRVESPIAPPPTIILNTAGDAFVDRSPRTFDIVLDYLRNGGGMTRTFTTLNDDLDTILVEFLRADAYFYGLKELVDQCDKFLARRHRLYGARYSFRFAS